jgi:hypothetical protein
VYYLRAESGSECRHIAKELTEYSKVARNQFEMRTHWERGQNKLKAAYDSKLVQGMVGVLILSVNE